MTRPIVFVSYSHIDKRDKSRLVTQIKVLERTSQVDLWDDDRLRAGSDWKREIDTAMTRASVAILLVTANYLTSDFIQDVEVPGLLERHKKEGLSIFPVIARECPWEEVSWLVSLNVRPKDGKPVWRSGGRYADKELANIAREVAGIIRQSDHVPNSALKLPAAIASHHHTRDEAIESISDELGRLKKLAEIKLSAVEQLIRLSISYGAPLYNHGAVLECAQIYLHTAKDLVAFMNQIFQPAPSPSALGTTDSDRATRRALPEHKAVNRDIALGVIHSELNRISTVSLTEQNAYVTAWNIRHVFDEVHFLVLARKAVDTSARAVNDSAAALIRSINAVAEIAISEVSRMNEEGITRNEDWIAGCAASLLYAAQTVHLLSERLGSPKDNRERRVIRIVERRIPRDLSFEQFVANDNPYQVAWDLQQAFDRLREATASTV